MLLLRNVGPTLRFDSKPSRDSGGVDVDGGCGTGGIKQSKYVVSQVMAFKLPSVMMFLQLKFPLGRCKPIGELQALTWYLSN